MAGEKLTKFNLKSKTKICLQSKKLYFHLINFLTAISTGPEMKSTGEVMGFDKIWDGIC